MRKYTFDHLRRSNWQDQQANMQLMEVDGLKALHTQAIDTCHDFINALNSASAFSAAVICYLFGREIERRLLVDETFEMLHTLKAAGYPQKGEGEYLEADYDPDTWPAGQPPPVGPYFPPLAEMIFTLGDHFGVLERFQHSGEFGAYVPNDIGISGTGATPFLALANLWLAVGADQAEREALASQHTAIEWKQAPPIEVPFANLAYVHNLFLDLKQAGTLPPDGHFAGCCFDKCQTPAACLAEGCCLVMAEAGQPVHNYITCHLAHACHTEAACHANGACLGND